MYEHLSSTAIDGAAFVRSVEGLLRALSNVRIGEGGDSKGYFYFDEASRKSRTNCEQYRLSSYAVGDSADYFSSLHGALRHVGKESEDAK